MEYLVYIIIGLYIWEVYLETHWYKLKDSIINNYICYVQPIIHKVFGMFK